MSKSLPVWSTLSEAFSLIQSRFSEILETLWIPALILVGIQVLFIFLVSNPLSPVHYIFDFASLLVFAWMMNATCRLVIQGSPGSKGWTSAETWTALWMIFLAFVVSVLAALPALAVFGLFFYFSPSFGVIAGGFTFVILHLYLYARFVLIFPATAMGDKTGFKDAWAISNGNGWRLVLLFALVPLIYFFAAGCLSLLLPVRPFVALLGVLGVFFVLVSVVALSLAYKRLS